MTDNVSASMTIAEVASSTVSKLIYKIVLRLSAGEPVAAEDVILTIEGDGSFAPNFHSHEVKRETDAAGEARVTWYRRSVYLRNVKAILTATATQPDRSVTLEVTDETPPDVKISFAKEEFKLPPVRV